MAVIGVIRRRHSPDGGIQLGDIFWFAAPHAPAPEVVAAVLLLLLMNYILCNVS
jgi:hypothetical protein